MARNYGLTNVKNVTSEAASGAQPQPRSHIARDTQRETNSGLLPNSRPKSGEPSIREFERGASLLFLFVVLLPIAVVGGLCLGYAAFAPEPVEYQVAPQSRLI